MISTQILIVLQFFNRFVVNNFSINYLETGANCITVCGLAEAGPTTPSPGLFATPLTLARAGPPGEVMVPPAGCIGLGGVFAT